MKFAKTIVVSRHYAFTQYLKEIGLIKPYTPILEHVTEDDVKGAHVIGMLPLRLCALAKKVTQVDLNVPKGKRGNELTLEEMKEYGAAVSSYEVKKIEEAGHKVYVSSIAKVDGVWDHDSNEWEEATFPHPPTKSEVVASYCEKFAFPVSVDFVQCKAVNSEGERITAWDIFPNNEYYLDRGVDMSVKPPVGVEWNAMDEFPEW